MTNAITRCLGVLLMLVPVSAMVAMVLFGVPRITPMVVLPGWQDRAALVGRGDSTSGQAARESRPKVSQTARLARPLPATSRRARIGQSMVSSRPSRAKVPNWNEVRAGLAAVGVDRFKIQPGGRDGEVHFSCVQQVPGRPRLLRRFEAEAEDPVLAASDVLEQIQQSAASSPWIVRSR